MTNQSPEQLRTLIVKLRYQGKQYSAGQFARGGGSQKHYLEDAADAIESLQAQAAKAEEQLAAIQELRAQGYTLSKADNIPRPCALDAILGPLEKTK